MNRIRLPSQTSTTALGVGFVLMSTLVYAVHEARPSLPFIDSFCSGLLALGAYLIRVPQHSPPPPAEAGITKGNVT